MQLRNKILLIFVVIVAFFTIPSFAASSNEFEYNDIVFTDDCFTYQYVTVCVNEKTSDNSFEMHVMYSEEPFLVIYDEANPDRIQFDKGDTSGFDRKIFHVIDGEVDNISSSSFKIGYTAIYSTETVVISSVEDLKNCIVFTDIDVCDADGNVVFQSPPSLERVTRKAQIIAGVVTQETLTAELAELVPVGVTILATMILVSLVAYFPHWKA